ncbi:relaxase/mobilization nuclease domain-containing protein [Nostoc sp. CALU 1950]|uniref:relaxase/mobilization nuclease domain-containing protein n=1 Tax=Nostoc sp. CALU 1950 TaxID=3104321 RepID=UPI003EB85900
MITKVKANKSFRGTTKYVLDKEKAKIIGGNMYGKSTNELVEQFTLSAHLNPQLKDPCYHLMLSIPKADGSLTDDELANLSQRHLASVIVLSRLQGDESQVKQPDKRIVDTKLNQLVDEFIESELPAYDFFIARHSDKEHDHTHIVASRVNNLDGKSIRTWNNYVHSEHSARLLEREFNLTPVQSSWESKRKAMTRNQRERVERDGLPGEEIMRQAIEQLAVDKPTMPEFIERLWSEHQVKAIVSYYSNGGVRGIKFGIDISSVNEDASPRLLWKQGGNLNKYKCSFSKLQSELGISYEAQQDDAEIKRLTQFIESAIIPPVNPQIVEQNSSNINTGNFQKIPQKPETIAEVKPLLTQAQSLELYRYYSLELENELVTDRDKKVAFKGLQDGKTNPEVEEILQASPADWNEEEARALVLIAKSQVPQRQPSTEAQRAEQQQLRQELLSIAVPVCVELINHLLKGTARNSLKFKHSTVSKQGRELVFTHDERGEVFRVKVNRNSQGEIEYSVVNIGEVKQSDIEIWEKANEILLEYIEHELQQSRTRDRGLSL